MAASISDIADVAAKVFLRERGDKSSSWQWSNGFSYSDVQIVDFSYPTVVPPAEITPKSLDSLTWENNTPSSGNYEEFDRSKTYTSTFSWSVTTGIKTSTSETTKASIPEIGDASETTSIELDVSTTETQTTTLTDTFSAKTHIQIPPYSKLTASLLISEGKLDIPWTANMQVKLGDNYDLISSSGADYVVASFAGWEEGSVVRFGVTGTFKGVQGYGAYVRTDSTPIPH